MSELSQDGIRVLKQINEKGLVVHWFHLSSSGKYDDDTDMTHEDMGIVNGELTRHWECVQAARNNIDTTDLDPGWIEEKDIHENDEWYESYENGLYYRYSLTPKAIEAIQPEEVP